MRLNEFNINSFYDSDYEVIRDADFDTLGLIGSTVEKRYLTFISNDKYLCDIKNEVVFIITTKEIYYEHIDILSKFGLCLVDNPKRFFFSLHNFLSDDISYNVNSFERKIGKNCIIDETVIIPKKNIVIGNNVTIEEYVKLSPNTIIGDNVVIRSHSIIGCQGFQFYDRKYNEFKHVKHIGKTVIENNVEIQNMTYVENAIYPWDETIIGSNTKLAYNCLIGHGSKIGSNCLISGKTVVGGRSIVGSNVNFGVGASIKHGGLVIGDNAFIGLGSVVIKNINAGEKVFGNPARRYK